MTVVVADTSPLNYLVQIDEADLLQKLYGTIFIPDEVFQELSHPGAPIKVNNWIKRRPTWLKMRSRGNCLPIASLMELDMGERAAIELAAVEKEVLLLLDDAKGRMHADRLGIRNVGTLGILRLAALENFVDLHVALDNLRHTNFRATAALISQLLVEDEERRRALAMLKPSGREK